MTDQQRAKNTQLAIHMLEQYNEAYPNSDIKLNEAEGFLLAETDQEFKRSLGIIFVLHNLAQEKLRAIEIVENTYLENENNYIKNKFLGGLN